LRRAADPGRGGRGAGSGRGDPGAAAGAAVPGRAVWPAQPDCGGLVWTPEILPENGSSTHAASLARTAVEYSNVMDRERLRGTSSGR